MITVDQLIEICQSGLVPHLEGPRGEGKTTFGHLVAQHVDKKLRVMNLNAMESTDFCGLPFVDSEGITRYAKPFWMADAEVILLDEIDRIRDSAVKSALLSLLIDKSINGHELRKDVIILTAGNGSDGDKYDTIDFDEAMKDRLVVIPFAYSKEQKIAYLKKKYSHNKFMKFLESKPELFKKFSSRRIESFMKVGNDLCAHFLDKETARLFKHFLESNLVSLQDIMTGNYKLETMSSITRGSIVKEISEQFYKISTAPEAANINAFINDLRAEEKTTYFTHLKKLCLEEPDKFKTHALKMNGLGLFSKQKEYLSELAK